MGFLSLGRIPPACGALAHGAPRASFQQLLEGNCHPEGCWARLWIWVEEAEMMFSSEQRPDSSLAQLCRYKRTLFPGLLPWHPPLAHHPQVKLMHGEKKDVRELSSEANASSCVGTEAVFYCCSTVCFWLAAGFLGSTATALCERSQSSAL